MVRLRKPSNFEKWEIMQSSLRNTWYHDYACKSLLNFRAYRPIASYRLWVGQLAVPSAQHIYKLGIFCLTYLYKRYLDITYVFPNPPS
ncbi:hypothetical protein ACN38_g4959 [Penicillium nordicum]|uniref:Uncharacterized protein n=1 Tax=Penicillium nordicum TaxID=229535 RepID=A0A0N0RZ22_9EURO|nr:hypothetical protein ACN38_g4959 [Penicillium nordicum]